MGLYFKFFYSILYHTSNSVFGTRKYGQKCETRIPAVASNYLIHVSALRSLSGKQQKSWKRV